MQEFISKPSHTFYVSRSRNLRFTIGKRTFPAKENISFPFEKHKKDKRK